MILDALNRNKFERYVTLLTPLACCVWLDLMCSVSVY